MQGERRNRYAEGIMSKVFLPSEVNRAHTTMYSSSVVDMVDGVWDRKCGLEMDNGHGENNEAKSVTGYSQRRGEWLTLNLVLRDS